MERVCYRPNLQSVLYPIEAILFMGGLFDEYLCKPCIIEQLVRNKISSHLKGKSTDAMYVYTVEGVIQKYEHDTECTGVIGDRAKE